MEKDNNSNEGKFILLDNNLKPAENSTNLYRKQNQSSIVEYRGNHQIKKEQKRRGGKSEVKRQKLQDPSFKKFAIGSKEDVISERDVGFFETVFCCYNNHWVLKTCPEDWWISITQKISIAIDAKANHPKVRPFFVSHEGKKKLTVDCTHYGSIYNVDYDWFFKTMTTEISKNINNPEYTDLLDCNFSTTTPVQKIANTVMLMYGFQKYFEYGMMFECGIPGVSMLGSEEDWKALIEKHKKMSEFLKPIDDILWLSSWFESSGKVLEKLLETYKGNPDKDWWSKIIFRHTTYGSGGSDDYGGWFISDFLGLGGLISTSLKDVPNGLNAVPLTINDNGNEETGYLVAGVTGYKVTTEDAAADPETKTSYPVVQSVHGWGLLLDPGKDAGFVSRVGMFQKICKISKIWKKFPEFRKKIPKF